MSTALVVPDGQTVSYGNSGNRELTQTPEGALNVNIAAGTLTGGGNAAAGPTGAAVPADGDYLAFSVGGTLTGVSAATPLPVTGNITTSNAAVGLLGAAAPLSGDQLAFQGPGGTLIAPSAANPLPVVTNGGSLSVTNIVSMTGVVAGDGTAGAPAGGVMTVQGVAGMTPVSTSGTTTLATGSTLALSAGSANIGHVDGEGTAGTAAGGVLTVQGQAGMVALKVDGSAVTQPISGSVTATPPTVTPTAATASAITTGGTATVLATAPWKGGFVQNPLLASDQNIITAEVIYLNLVTTATANGRGSNVCLQLGDVFLLPPMASGTLSAIAATTAHAVSIEVFV